ncbi:hypothetical protein EYF80_044301 [Liparis tanakae]|uniref:Uncharacterized protein n=1 Tax=Liparis tanakae TaxID=230148 RepID=A0A4Z2FWA2_9TELE|nr:hypothetical protein EYF80_044301 [Liparis tanakae]
MTLLAKDALLSVAKPRSPIFTEPVGPVMKMLSHFRSLWMMGGALVCRKWRPLRICRHHERSTLIFITLKRFRYLRSRETQRRGEEGAAGSNPSSFSTAVEKSDSTPLKWLLSASKKGLNNHARIHRRASIQDAAGLSADNDSRECVNTPVKRGEGRGRRPAGDTQT